MKLKSLIITTLSLALSMLLMSCSNPPKKSRTIIGELTLNSNINQNFSKFSGTESYKFTISDQVTFSYDLKLRTGKITLSLVDEDGEKYINVEGQSKDSIKLSPNKKTTYFVDLSYDNGVGSYSLSIQN